MKKVLFTMLLFATMISFASCSSDDDEIGLGIKERIIGTWEGTAALVDGTWIDITHYPYSARLGFSATFYNDGTYYGRGAFGTGRGTYKVNGNTIETYIDNELYLKYRVKEITGTSAELTIIEGTSTLDVRVRKAE